MARKKLVFSEEDLIEIEKFRKYFADLEIDGTEISSIYAGGCGEQCQITCAHYCEDTCERHCNENCNTACSGIFLDNPGCFYCGTFMNFWDADQ